MSAPAPAHHEFKIQIDRVHYTVGESSLSGLQLRQLPEPPIPPDRDLYQVRPGQDDLLIADGDAVEMHNGVRFFTAPGQINPGRMAWSHGEPSTH